MNVAFFVEASQPCGRVYRIGVGCELHPTLVSTLILVIARLFRWKGTPATECLFLSDGGMDHTFGHIFCIVLAVDFPSVAARPEILEFCTAFYSD